MRRGVLYVALGSLIVTAAAGVAAQRLQPRTLFIEVLDEIGAPLADLKPSDLELTEGGVRRQVTRTELGTAPMRIAFLVDTGEAAEQLTAVTRSALQWFLEIFEGTDEMALVAIGRQPRILLKPTTDRARMKKTVDSLFNDGGGTVLLDGVRDTYEQIMKQPEVRWPVYVLITTAAPDKSGIMQKETYGRLVDDLRMRGATFHAIVLQLGAMGSAFEYARDFADSTGGSFSVITTSSALRERLGTLAGRIMSDHAKMATRYTVDYLGDSRAQGAIEVELKRTGARLRKTSNTRPF